MCPFCGRPKERTHSTCLRSECQMRDCLATFQRVKRPNAKLRAATAHLEAELAKIARWETPMEPPKYQLNQLIHYIREGKPHSAKILALRIVVNAHEEWANTDHQKFLFTPFGPAGVEYFTCHGAVQESEITDAGPAPGSTK